MPFCMSPRRHQTYLFALMSLRGQERNTVLRTATSVRDRSWEGADTKINMQKDALSGNHEREKKNLLSPPERLELSTS